MTTTPTYGRPADLADTILAAAEDLGGQHEGLAVRFDDGSELRLVPVRRANGHGYLIALPPDPRDRERPATTAPARDE